MIYFLELRLRYSLGFLWIQWGFYMDGKINRMKRFFSFHSNRTILLPVDHGTTLGPIYGLERLETVIEQCVNSGKINGVIGHRRIFPILAKPSIQPISGILHLCASTRLSNSNTKVLVAHVEDALRLGADAVSVHVNLGEITESAMLHSLGMIVSKAMEYALPVLAMVYVRKGDSTSYTVDDVALSARVVDDIGADIIKVPYTGTVEGFERVVEACCAPVIIAGGELIDTTEDVIAMVAHALDAGAKGISIGRNIFAIEHTNELLDALALLVHKNASLHSATMLYKTAVAHKKKLSLS